MYQIYIKCQMPKFRADDLRSWALGTELSSKMPSEAPYAFEPVLPKFANIPFSDMFSCVRSQSAGYAS